jgi:ABC-type bacteriocin/lantibiotic exporter with double-glycine peptidase domain
MQKILKILPVDEKKNLFIFFCLIIVIMILESLSVGAIFPLLLTILSDNFESEYTYILIQGYTGNISYDELLLLLLIIISLLFILKNFFLIFMQWWIHGFNNRIQFKIQKELLEIYLFQSFLDVLKKNSALKIRNISVEVSKFSKYFMALMLIIVESMIVIAISTVLVFLNPKVAISLITAISIPALAFYLFAKLKVINWSEKKILHGGLSTKMLIESLAAIKELKIFNKENLFLEKYSFHEKKYLYLSRLFATLNDIPKILLETIMIVTISIFIISMTYLGIEKREIIATLGIFTIAGFRLFPSSTRIIRSINEVKNNLPSINLIIKELSLKNNTLKDIKSDNFKIKFDNLIEFKNVSFCYPDKDQYVFENFNLKIKKGEKLALLGESGSGKSTLLNLIIGFLDPSKGEILLDGQKIFENPNQFKNLFSYVSQETFLLDESIKYNITFNQSITSQEEEKLKDIIEVVNLKNLINELDKGLDTLVGEKGVNISGGQRQRISIARAIFNSREILILDEPTKELDEMNERIIMKKIFEKYKDKTIIITTHNKELMNFCDVIISFNKGKIEITNNEKINSKIF